MIWEIGQDAFGENNEFSLLSAIDYVIKTGSLPVTAVDDIALLNTIRELTFFPNPFQNQFTISAIDEITSCKIKLSDLQGRVILDELHHSFSSKKTFDLSEIPSGVYILTLEINDKTRREKLIKN